jgi:exodeoxyribonuclease-3
MTERPTIRIKSYNTLFAGLDGTDDRRRRLQVGIVCEAAPDVLLYQEGKGLLESGSAPLFELERAFGMRALLAEAPDTGQNTAVFIRPGIEPLSFEADAVHFHHLAAIARLGVPGLEAPLTAVSVHLCPNSGHLRLSEAAYPLAHADPSALAVVGGDFNSPAVGDPEPVGLDALPAQFRARYIGSTGTVDRRAHAALAEAGFVDVGAKLGDLTRTVPGADYPDAEFVPFRSDYLLASESFAERVVSYRVIDGPKAGSASDHYPVIAELRR